MPPPDAPGGGRARLDSLTGLRFVAALGVFSYHAQPLLPQWAALRPLLAGGQSGVSFFFVLSGFVLTWSAAGDRVAARAFWRRRAARILPAYFVTWLVGIPVTWLTFAAWPTARALLGTGTLTQAWFDDKSIYFGVNGVGWSLSCEVLFYALFPVLLPAVRRLTRRGLLGAGGACLAALFGLAVAGLLVAGRGVGDPAGAAFWWVSVLPVSRLPEFLIGMLAARAVVVGAVPAVPLRWAALSAGVGAGAAGLFPAAAVAGWLTAVPFGLLICAAARSDLLVTPGFLGRRWWVRLGTWSYAFYLSHQLVLRVSEWLWPATSAQWLHLIAGLAAAVATSAALYRFVEQPGERRWRLGGGAGGLPVAGQQDEPFGSAPPR